METRKQSVEIGVRYCGGCNPTYDRAAFVRKLQGLLPEVSFVNAQGGVHYPAAVIVNGCFATCTKTDDLSVPEDRLVRVACFRDLLSVRDQVLSLLEEKKPIALDRTGVLEILPHRPPMLFVDEVTYLIPGKEATASLQLDPEWPLFRGHFPEVPVFPGVMAVEAMAQTADLMVMTLDCYAGKEPLLMEVNRARFKRKLLPGTKVQLHAALREERRDLGIVVCRCQVMEEEKLCAEAEITLAMR